MRPIKIILTSLALASSSLAMAQATAPAAAPAASASSQVKAGAQVFDTSGAEAATVESVSGDLVVVSTGTNKITMPMASFAAGAKGPVVSVTKAQLDAAAVQAAAQSAAALKSALVAGAPVHGSGGVAVVGTVKTVGDPNVVIATPKGDVAVPLSVFSAGPGGLKIGLTQAEFDAAAAQATASAAK